MNFNPHDGQVVTSATASAPSGSSATLHRSWRRATESPQPSATSTAEPTLPFRANLGATGTASPCRPECRSSSTTAQTDSPALLPFQPPSAEAEMVLGGFSASLTRDPALPSMALLDPSRVHAELQATCAQQQNHRPIQLLLDLIQDLSWQAIQTRVVSCNANLHGIQHRTQAQLVHPAQLDVLITRLLREGRQILRTHRWPTSACCCSCRGRFLRGGPVPLLPRSSGRSHRSASFPRCQFRFH